MDISYPKTISISDRNKKLIEDYLCELPNGDTLTIKKGIIYDGASIPKIFWSLVGSPFTGKYQRAAFLHDIFYKSELYAREECDWLFLLIMKYHGCNWVKRNIIWSGVRSFGGIVWANHKKEDVENMRKKITLKTGV